MRLLTLSLAAILLASCTSDSVRPGTVGGATLLRHDLAPEDITERGAIDGELVLFNGCVGSGLDPESVTPVEFEESAAYLVFPAGYDLRESGSTVEVIDADGTSVGRIGDRARLYGQAYELEEAEQHVDIPEACRESGTPTGSPLTDKWWFVVSASRRATP